MLTLEENELITRVGEGTPGGDLYRRYWLPLLLTEELTEAQNAPVPVRALGEDFVAFRDASGRARVIGAYCPHRRTNLVYARYEDCGLRCLYHGWVMDGEGRIAEMPNDSEGIAKGKFSHRWCPTVEAGGLVWGYLGPPEDQPPAPPMGWTNIPSSQLAVTKVRINCNFLQCLEGGLDPSHAGSLHAGSLAKDETPDHPRSNTDMFELLVGNKAPTLDVELMDIGMRIAAHRKVNENTDYIRITTWVAPWFSSVPEHEGVPRMINGFTPIDDTSTWVWFIWYDPVQDLNVPALKKASGIDNLGPGYQTHLNVGNQHLQDRVAMRENRSYSGITGISNEDTAMQEAQGPIANRTEEHLIKADLAIIRMRQGLIQRVRDLQGGNLPTSRSEDIPYRFSQSASWTYPSEKRWQDGYAELRDNEPN